MHEITKFERAVIQGVLAKHNSRQTMSQINYNYFTTIQLREIFKHISNYYDKFSSIPKVVILINEISKDSKIKIDDFNNIRAFLEKKVEIDLDEFNYAIEEVEKNYFSRRMKTSIKRAIELIEEGKVDKAQDELVKGATALSVNRSRIRVVDFVDNFTIRKAELLKRKENPEIINEFAVPTGIEKLDYQLDGGLRKGELGIILGQPSGGKSITLQDFSVSAVLLGFKVAYFTIEMTPEQTAYRLDSRLSQIKYRKFRRAEIDDEEVKIWEEKIKSIKENSLKIIGVPENCNCKLIEAELSKMSNVFIPDVVMIDYTGIMSPNNSDNSLSTMDWRYIGEILRNLKEFALKFNLPTWSGAQLLVDSKNKPELTFKDIGLAKQQVAAHADIGIALIQTKQMRLMDVFRVQFVKAREGCEEPILEFRNDFDRISLERRTEDKEIKEKQN